MFILTSDLPINSFIDAFQKILMTVRHSDVIQSILWHCWP